MKRIISLTLALMLMLSLAACTGGNEETPTETKAKTDVYEPLTWDQINAIPLADDSMTEEQLRQICLDYMRMMLTFTWTPSEDVTYNNGSTNKPLLKGSVYAGLPYTPACNGNIYTLMEFYDSENGMLDLSGGVSTVQLISNQCSSSTFWAWNRVCNSIWYTSTSAALECNGYLRVGPYTYDETATKFGSDNSTNDICMKNGPEVMFESYAMCKPADGLVQNKGDGHFRMVASVNVVKNGDTIDGAKSTITYVDQIRSWTPGTQPNGVPYETEGGVDVEISFFELFNAGYIPVTFAELNKADPVEKSETTFSHTGDSITITQLVNAMVNSNYCISDITFVVKDSSGNEVYKNTGFAHIGGVGIKYEASASVALKRDELLPYADGKHTIEISTRIGTGEKPVVYTGTLSA